MSERGRGRNETGRFIIVDQEARDLANEALAAIAGHEKVCTERQGHIIEGLNAVRRGVEGLYNRFWIASCSAIGLLVALCGFLAGKLLHWI